jgi:hypothetical protein
MGFTEKAVEKNARLLTPDGRRTWDVWDRPPPSPPGVVTAFHLVFLSSELGVPPEQRSPKDWGEVIYIEPAPAGQMLLLTLFVTTNEPILKPKGDVPSVCLASLGIGSDRFARLVAYGAPEDDIPEIIARWASQVRTKAHSAGMALPPGTFGYLLGRRDDGVRYIVSARVFSN